MGEPSPEFSGAGEVGEPNTSPSSEGDVGAKSQAHGQSRDKPATSSFKVHPVHDDQEENERERALFSTRRRDDRANGSCVDEHLRTDC